MSGPIALISDIHSNLEALEVVLAEIDRRQIRTIYCLGDIVGYGPDPGPVIELVRTRCQLVLRGNHDEALFRGAHDFNQIAKQALETNAEMIRPGFFRPSVRKVWWAWLRDLRTSEQRGDRLFVHGSPRDPVREYVLASDMASKPRVFEEIFQLLPHVGFGGHTHQPGVFIEGVGHRSPYELNDVYHFSQEKVFVNVGSVGQPRDNNPRTCFAIVDDEKVEWVRLEYDIPRTQEKIYRNPGIDDLCGHRLAVGR